jgi:transposase-like protein
MSKKKFSTEVRARAVDEYTSGLKSAQELSEELGTTPQSIYRWKTVYTERQKDIRLDEIISDGNTREQAKKIQQLELQVEAYKIKLAEQMLINDLLKKIQDPHDSASENELNGLIDTTSKLARKRKPAKP